jgi:hypothetical protein
MRVILWFLLGFSLSAAAYTNLALEALKNKDCKWFNTCYDTNKGDNENAK